MFTVSTVNVNGLRAAAKKGYQQWLDATDADVVALQEVRAEPDQLSAALREPPGWHCTIAPAAEKGRAGVALLSREEPTDVRIGFGGTSDSAEFDSSGRYVEYEFDHLIVGSLYLPSGEVGTSRQDDKERFMDTFLAYLRELRDRADAEDKDVLVAGDWNIAHAEIDLKNWKNNQKTAGFLPSERSWLSRVFDEAGLVDVHRLLEPEGPGPYSWWSYRGRAFDNDAGWRIDYQIATPRLAHCAVEATVERASSYDKRWSDHAPVTIRYERRHGR